MSVSKTTTLFNLKFPSNDVKLNLNFLPSQIISLNEKYREFKESISDSFSLDFCRKSIAWLSHLVPHTDVISSDCLFTRTMLINVP